MAHPANTNRHGTRRMLRLAAGVAMIAMMTLAPAAASGHGDDEPAAAFDLVRQAIALIVSTPGNQMAITDKIDDALAATDTANVQLNLVGQAKDALAAGDLHQTRALLERSIGARVHTSTADPVAIGQPPPLTGEQTGTLAALDAIPGRHRLHSSDWALLAVSVLVAAAGVVAAARIRPHLPHPARTQKPR